MELVAHFFCLLRSILPKRIEPVLKFSQRLARVWARVRKSSLSLLWQRVKKAKLQRGLASNRLSDVKQELVAAIPSAGDFVYRQALLAETVAVTNYLHALQEYHAALESQHISKEEPVQAEGHDLTVRERQVLALIASGKSSKQIAARLGIAFKTVVVHRYHLQTKLNAHNTADLMRVAIRMGLIEI